MDEHRGVLVCAEVVEGALSANSLELLGCGRRLADALGEELSCVLLAGKAGEAPKEAISYGADVVYAGEDTALEGLPLEAFLPVVEGALRESPRRIVLVSQGFADLAVRLAFRLDVSLASNCTALALDPESRTLRQTRPVYGGKAYSVVGGTKSPQLATLRPKAQPPASCDPQREGRIVRLQLPEPAPARTTVLGVIRDEDDARIGDARVLVSGGRGVGGPEAFTTLLRPLADALDGEVSSSRPPVDSGWISKSRLVGITGAIVAPELYVAVGISGSVQHLTGCRNAKTIVAVNKDKDAPIFEYADFGVVGPCEEVIPALTRRVEELKR